LQAVHFFDVDRDEIHGNAPEYRETNTVGARNPHI
jgi:hypothetical protein